MPRKAKPPDVSKIPVLYAAYWPGNGHFYSLTNFFPHELAATATASSPAILHGEVAAFQRKNRRTARYWIVKYIPVAILDTEYRQQRIPAESKGSTE